jgi:AraC-like DNA-binding protein
LPILVTSLRFLFRLDVFRRYPAFVNVNRHITGAKERASKPEELGPVLARKIDALAQNPGERPTAIPGLTIYRLTAPTACYAAEYETALAVFVQGKKRATFGRTTYLCDGSTFLLTSADVPLVSEVVEASEKSPLLLLFLKLDLAIVREILDREEFKSRNGRPPSHSPPVGRTTSELLKPCVRMLELLDTPAEIPFFSDLIHREIVYRLLQCPQGDLLRAIARLDDDRRGTGKALAWLRANYAKPFRLEQLASMARMGTSTFNHRFRAATSLSPLQYQKQLRLLSARERMLIEGLDATAAALEVGYESITQFTREYKRLFGQPPMRDIRGIRSADTAS